MQRNQGPFQIDIMQSRHAFHGGGAGGGGVYGGVRVWGVVGCFKWFTYYKA